MYHRIVAHVRSLAVKETPIVQAIRLALGRMPDCVLWRNNTGVATFQDRPVRYGLANGSSDLIGIVAGRFVALEVKTLTGRASDEQNLFLNLVRQKGGFACVVRSVDDALSAIDRCRKGLSE
jgi:hypothetical protein